MSVQKSFFFKKVTAILIEIVKQTWDSDTLTPFKNIKQTLFLGSFRLNIIVLYLFMYLLSVLRNMSNISTSILATSFTASLSDIFKSLQSPTLQKWNGSSWSLKKTDVLTYSCGYTLTSLPGCWRGTSGCSVWSGCWAEMVWTRERWEQVAPADSESRSEVLGPEKVLDLTTKPAQGWTKAEVQMASLVWWMPSYRLRGLLFHGREQMWMVFLRLWPDSTVLCWGVYRDVCLKTGYCWLAPLVFLVHWQAEKMEQHLQQSPLETDSEELQLQPPVFSPI